MSLDDGPDVIILTMNPLSSLHFRVGFIDFLNFSAHVNYNTFSRRD